MKKGDIVLSVGGTLAGLALSYLLYVKEQENSAANAAAAATAAQTAQQNAATQQAQQSYDLASLPSISVPSLSVSIPSDSGSQGNTSSDGQSSASEDTTVSNLLSNALGNSGFAGIANAYSASQTPIAALTASQLPSTAAGPTPDYSNLTSVTGLGTLTPDASTVASLSQVGSYQTQTYAQQSTGPTIAPQAATTPSAYNVPSATPLANVTKTVNAAANGGANVLSPIAKSVSKGLFS